MRTDSDDGASSLPTRHAIVRSTARDGQPQTHIDEQPSGSTPRRCGDSVPALFALHVRSCLSAVAKRGNTVSDQRLQNGRVLMHDSSFRQDLL